jgi:hypothetical protein
MRAQTVFSTTATTGGLESEIGDKLRQWMASDLSKLDLLVIQIDGLGIHDDLVLVDCARHRWQRSQISTRPGRGSDREYRSPAPLYVAGPNVQLAFVSPAGGVCCAVPSTSRACSM